MQISTDTALIMIRVTMIASIAGIILAIIFENSGQHKLSKTSFWIAVTCVALMVLSCILFVYLIA